jgi:hypothetical protein
MKVIAQVGGEGSALFCAHQVDHAEPEVQQEAVHALEVMPYSRAMGRALFDAYRRAGESHRRRVLALVARSRDQRFVEHLAEYVEEHAAGLDVEEASVIGKVMGQLGGAGSLAVWQEWLKPSGLLRKEIHGPLARQVAAACALGEIPGEEAAHALRAALVAASAEAEPWIGRSLSHHQRALHRKATP